MITSSVNRQLAEKLRHTYVTGQGQRSRVKVKGQCQGHPQLDPSHFNRTLTALS